MEIKQVIKILFTNEELAAIETTIGLLGEIYEETCGDMSDSAQTISSELNYFLNNYKE